MAKGRGAGLRPVQDVVSRIRYDATLDAARFVVGYEERNAGIRESPLPVFVAGGDVPWHRVQYVKAGPLTVWDRQSRVDLVFGSGDSPAADLAALSAAPPPLADRPRRQRAVACTASRRTSGCCSAAASSMDGPSGSSPRTSPATTPKARSSAGNTSCG